MVAKLPGDLAFVSGAKSGSTGHPFHSNTVLDPPRKIEFRP